MWVIDSDSPKIIIPLQANFCYPGRFQRRRGTIGEKQNCFLGLHMSPFGLYLVRARKQSTSQEAASLDLHFT